MIFIFTLSVTAVDPSGDKHAVYRYNKDIKGEKVAGENLTSEGTILQPGVATHRVPSVKGSRSASLMTIGSNSVTKVTRRR